MTFSVTGLPHYQSAVAGSGSSDPQTTSLLEMEMVSTPASGILLDEDQGSWFGMGFLNSKNLSNHSIIQNEYDDFTEKRDCLTAPATTGYTEWTGLRPIGQN